jgi:hypothetical protein
MITTGENLTDFITGLNGGMPIDATLLDVLVSTAKTVIEGHRPWMVLRAVDTTKTASPSNTWQTAIDLSTITDFAEFYSETPITLFDGSNTRALYRMVPWDRRLEYKDVSDTCVYNPATKQLYLNGSVSISGTLYISYKVTSTEIDLASNSAVWTLFPARFLPVLGFYARGLFSGAVDYDDVVKSMLPANQAAFLSLMSAMESWDNSLQASSMEWNDPAEPYGYPRSGAINRNS